MRFVKLVGTLILISVAPAASVRAEVTNWSAFKDGSNCWAVTKSSNVIEAQGGSISGVDVSNSLLFASLRGSKAELEVAFSAGHALAEGSRVKVTIGSKSFEFFASDDWAWPISEQTDRAVAGALLSGSSARLTAWHRDGRSIVYDFSLSGALSATKEAARLCGVSLPSALTSQATKPRNQGDSKGKE